VSALADQLRARHPRVRVGDGDDSLTAYLDLSTGWYSARVRSAPLAEVYIGLPPLDGFAMTIEDATSGWPWTRGDIAFDRRYRVTTNDPALAAAWLDDAATAAVLSQRYEASTLPAWRGIALPALVRAPTIERGWRFELIGHELAVLKGAPESDPVRLCDAVDAGLAVAGSCYRLAAGWQGIAAALGGRCTAARWDAGVDFAVQCDRDGAPVRIAHVRRRSGEPPAEHRLRTAVVAPRVTPHDDALVVWRRGALAQPQRPARKLAPLPLPGLDGFAARASDRSLATSRLDAAARALIHEAAAEAVELDAREVAVWFDGLVDDVPRLDAAVGLCARLAVDGSLAAAPYR
jgi:hypothetical protein